MQLRLKDLERVSRWEPLLEKFRDGTYENELQIEDGEIKPFISKLKAYKELSIDVLERGKYGSYYSVFVSSDKSDSQFVEGYQVNLSTLLPVSVVGKTNVIYNEKTKGYSLVDLNELLCSEDLIDRCGIAIKDSLIHTCYKIL